MRRHVINLAGATDRLAHMEREFARLGLPFERLDALRGVDLLPPGASHPRFTAGTLGCLASHLEACRRIAASGDPWGAVLEDDMWFSDDAARFLADWDWIPAGVDLVKLETYGTLTCLERGAVAERGGHGLHRLLDKHLGGGAYLISARLAARLAAIDPLRCTDPIDTLLFNPRHLVMPGQTTLQVMPAVAIQDFKKVGADAARLVSSLEPDRAERRAGRYDGVFGRLRAASKPARRALKAAIVALRRRIALARYDWIATTVPFGPRSDA